MTPEQRAAAAADRAAQQKLRMDIEHAQMCAPMSDSDSDNDNDSAQDGAAAAANFVDTAHGAVGYAAVEAAFGLVMTTLCAAITSWFLTGWAALLVAFATSVLSTAVISPYVHAVIGEDRELTIGRAVVGAAGWLFGRGKKAVADATA